MHMLYKVPGYLSSCQGNQCWSKVGKINQLISNNTFASLWRHIFIHFGKPNHERYPVPKVDSIGIAPWDTFPMIAIKENNGTVFQMVFFQAVKQLANFVIRKFD